MSELLIDIRNQRLLCPAKTCVLAGFHDIVRLMLILAQQHEMLAEYAQITLIEFLELLRINECLDANILFDISRLCKEHAALSTGQIRNEIELAGLRRDIRAVCRLIEMAVIVGEEPE